MVDQDAYDEFFAKAEDVLCDAEWEPPRGAARWSPDAPGDLDYTKPRPLSHFPLNPHMRSDESPTPEAAAHVAELTADNAADVLIILNASPGALSVD